MTSKTKFSTISRTKPCLKKHSLTSGNDHLCNAVEVEKPANKRLALVWDAVLRLAIVDHWWEEGDTSRRKLCDYQHNTKCSVSSTLSLETCENTCQGLASNRNLTNRRHSMGIDKQVTKNTGQSRVVPKPAMTSTLGAVMGAAWLNSGKNWSVTRAVATKLYREEQQFHSPCHKTLSFDVSPKPSDEQSHGIKIWKCIYDPGPIFIFT